MGVVAIAMPLFIPIYRWEYAATAGRSVIWAPVCLFVCFVLGLPLWGKRIHQLQKLWPALGLHGGLRWGRDWLSAFGLGVAGVAVLFGLQVIVGWGTWTVAISPARLLWNLLEGLLVGLGVGVAEELIFRGWLLFELERDYSLSTSLWINAVIFAIAHFIRPIAAIIETWPQFFGLLLLGLTLAWARRIPVRPTRSGMPQTTLALAAGLHGGLVWANYQVDVGDLVIPTGRVPTWVTGIGGNPLAGLLGVLLLSVIAYLTYTASHPPLPKSK